MADDSIVFWSGIPGGSTLTANASKKSGGGTFAVAGYLLDETGNHTKIAEVPFQAALGADHVYQLVLEVLPVGGAVVDVEATVERGGQQIRGTDWDPVQGASEMRGVFARMEKS